LEVLNFNLLRGFKALNSIEELGNQDVDYFNEEGLELVEVRNSAYCW
jgi:hypothetical protein